MDFVPSLVAVINLPHLDNVACSPLRLEIDPASVPDHYLVARRRRLHPVCQMAALVSGRSPGVIHRRTRRDVDAAPVHYGYERLDTLVVREGWQIKA